MRYFRPQPNRNTRHRIKTFDPSALVRNQPQETQPVQEEYVAKHTFSDFGFHTSLLSNIAARRYATLTPIQDQVIPLMISGKDVVGIANTGTGKTAAFLTPLIQKVVNDRSQRVLILAPTRELAVQIEQEFRSFSRNMGLGSALCIGGVSMGGQIQSLRRNPNFVIGTPGRIKDLGNQREIKFVSFNNVILDEVDRMLDMGFVRDITQIVTSLAKNRQSAFFSATTTPEVTKIMNGLLSSPILVSVRANLPLNNISQKIVKANGKPKIEVLHSLLISPGFDKVLVFGRTKYGLERMANDLSKRGFAVVAIHGNKSQSQRQRSLEQFKNNRVKVLLATDVASRGLDIDNVTHVINYDLPESYEDYIHRIGRTGRANKAGIALTLVD
jgi:ATP-dependent RNA helicase RhlE